VETLGPERLVRLRVSAPPVLTDEVLDAVRDVDTSIANALTNRPDARAAQAIARFDADAEVTVGETREIAVVPDKLRFFDLETGAAIH
jgi:hypothetical protein